MKSEARFRDNDVVNLKPGLAFCFLSQSKCCTCSSFGIYVPIADIQLNSSEGLDIKKKQIDYLLGATGKYKVKTLRWAAPYLSLSNQ
jgi:hypothetical protein